MSLRRAWVVLLLAGCTGVPDRTEPTVLSLPPPPSADELYQEAERLFLSGDFERSRLHCKEALGTNPYHAAAAALAVELDFIIGQGKRDAAQMALARLWQFDTLLDEGRRQLFFGSLNLAEECAERAQVLAEILPPEMDVELRVHQVQALQEWIRAFREEFGPR